MKLIYNNNELKIIEYKSFINKFIGLMFKKENINYGIRLNNCNSIHTFFMKQNIDICITDKNNKVLFLKENLNKNRIIKPIKNGYYTYELPLNTAKYFKIDNFINII